MLSVAAYPMSRPVAAPLAQRGGFIAYARGATLAIWMFALVSNFWYISDWQALQSHMQGNDVRGDYVIGFAICAVAHLTLGLTIWLAAPFQIVSTWSGRLLSAFCAIQLLVAPLSSIATTSAIYSAGTWAVLLVLYLYWQSNYQIVQRTTVLAGIVVLGWVLLLLMKHGLVGSFGSAIGGLNRNTTAFAALGGMVCCLLSPHKKIRWPAIGAAGFLALIVLSRGSIVAMAAFLAVYYACFKGPTRAILHAAILGVLAAAVMLAIPAFREVLFERVFLLHDQARGIGSGFTGRIAFWQRALDAFWEKPIFGYGFRATTHRGQGGFGDIHSGYLKILVETGFVGAFFVLSAVVVELIRRYRLVLQFHKMPPHLAPHLDIPETTRINAIACATIAMTMTVWVYEQLYINLGSTISLVFFLMMAAPAYVTRQGITIR